MTRRIGYKKRVLSQEDVGGDGKGNSNCKRHKPTGSKAMLTPVRVVTMKVVIMMTTLIAKLTKRYDGYESTGQDNAEDKKE
jgi:hypothetical protein